LPGLQKRIAERPADSTVTLDVERDGKTHRIALKAVSQPSERGDEDAYPPLGMSLSELTPAMGRRRSLDSSRGLLVTGVRPGGPAAVARPVISAGDLLLRVGGKPVSTLAELDAAAKAAGDKAVVVELERNGEQRLSVMTPVFGDRVRTPLPDLPKAWVGAEVQPITASLARDMALPAPGFRVTRLYPGSPLAKAGARVGDLLLTLDGEKLEPNNETSSESFLQRVHDLPFDGTARIDPSRAGKPLSFQVRALASPLDTSGCARWR